MLEVQRRLLDYDQIVLLNGAYEHVGYMNKIFKSKPEAAAYYDRYNPHMRGLMVHGNLWSDWDPDTRLRYVIREHNAEILSLPPFGDDK